MAPLFVIELPVASKPIAEVVPVTVIVPEFSAVAPPPCTAVAFAAETVN